MSEDQELKHKLLFSQNILNDTLENELKLDKRFVCQSLSAKAKQEGCFQRFLESDFSVEKEYELEAAQKWVTYPGILKISFPLQTIQPKVQMIRKVTRRKLPRDVEVDRRRRRFAKPVLQDMIQKANIENYELMSVKDYEDLCDKFKVNKYNLDRMTFMPLYIFDNSDFCDYTAEKWLNLGLIDGVYHPLPAFAFLPVKNIEAIETNFPTIEEFNEIKNTIYDWRIVAVSAFNEKTKLWTVQRLDNAEFYQIPKIQFMFIAESPDNYIIRIQYALKYRAELEHWMKYQLIVDCLQSNSVGNVPQKTFSKIISILSAIKKNVSPRFIESFKK